MTLRLAASFNYFTLLLLFWDGVFAIKSSCNLKASLFKLKSQDKLLNRDELSNRSFRESDPTSVNISLTINDLNILDARSLDIEMDLEMTQRWYDDRLAPDYQTQKLAVLGAIWEPKITFVVGNTCSKIFDTDRRTQFWRGTSNGSVLYSERYLVKPKCTKNLARYPFDVQTCFIKIGSYRFTAEEVILSWNTDAAFQMNVDKELGEFKVRDFDIHEESNARSAGNFSVLVVEIRLERRSHREVIQSVLPSFVLVKMAYTVFWIKLSAIRERIFTCQFSLFGTLFLFINSNCFDTAAGNARNYQLKALDIWFFVCLILILVPLIESVIMTQHLSHPDRAEDLRLSCNEIDSESECRTIASGRNWAVHVEKILRILHPIVSLCCATLFFTIFNENHADDGD